MSKKNEIIYMKPQQLQVLYLDSNRKTIRVLELIKDMKMDPMKIFKKLCSILLHTPLDRDMHGIHAFMIKVVKKNHHIDKTGITNKDLRQIAKYFCESIRNEQDNSWPMHQKEYQDFVKQISEIKGRNQNV